MISIKLLQIVANVGNPHFVAALKRFKVGQNTILYIHCNFSRVCPPNQDCVRNRGKVCYIAEGVRGAVMFCDNVPAGGGTLDFLGLKFSIFWDIGLRKFGKSCLIK